MPDSPFIHSIATPVSSAGELMAAAGVPSADIIGVITDTVAVVGGGGNEIEPPNDPNETPNNPDVDFVNTAADAYTADTEKVDMPPMEQGRLRGAAAFVGNCAVFAGGAGVNEDTNGAYLLSSVEAYTSFYDHRSMAELDIPRFDLAAASVGDYVLFAGGTGPIDEETGIYEPVSTIDVYNLNLTKAIVPIQLESPVAELCGITFGDWAVFAGGSGRGVPSDRIIAFDKNLIAKRDIAPLSVARSGLAAAVATDPKNPEKSYLILAGGFDGYNVVNTVDVYDQDWNKVAKSIPPLSIPRSLLSGNGTGGYALFAGGFDGAEDVSTVDVYDYNLQKLNNMSLAQARVDMATAVIEDKIFFFGGDASGYVSNVVDVFSLNGSTNMSTVTYHWMDDAPVPTEHKINFKWDDNNRIRFAWDTRAQQMLKQRVGCQV